MSSEQPKEYIITEEDIGEALENAIDLRKMHDLMEKVMLRSRPLPAPVPRLNTQPKECTCEDCQRFRKEKCPYSGSNITMDRCNSFLIDIVKHDRKAREELAIELNRQTIGKTREQILDMLFECQSNPDKFLESLRHPTTPQSEQEERR